MSGTVQTREALSKRLSELEDQALRLKNDISEPMSADFEEQAVEAEDDEALLAQETMVMARIVSIRAAIARVDEGRYGLCLTCGEAIAPGRLKVLPEASQCIACATES